MLLEYLKADDAADATADADEFTRGIRRAIRLRLAYAAKLHRHAGQSWTEWVSQYFDAGYSCYQRYHVAAELQVGLLARGLPALANENQARALALFRQHEKFWVAVETTFKTGFPVAHEVRAKLQHALGFDATNAALTTRLRLHRVLERVVRATPADDPLVAEALGLVRRAVATLERGRTAS